MTTQTDQLTAELKQLAALAEEALDRYLPQADQEPRELHEAIRYAALAGGKRVRPALTFLLAEA